MAIDERDVSAIGLKRGKEEGVVVRQSGGENGRSGERENHWLGREAGVCKELEGDCVNHGEELV